MRSSVLVFFFQAEDGIRDLTVTGVQTCALPIWTDSPTPTLIAGALSFAAVSAFGRYHSCGFTAAGVAYCWGYNGWGQLGDGTGYDAYAPVQVIGQAAGTGAASARASRVQRGGTRGPSRQLSPRPSSPRSAWAVRTGMQAGKPR